MSLDSLKASLRQAEGVLPTMYLDSKGLVTCGIGHLLVGASDAEKLPWVSPAVGNRPCSSSEIRAEFFRVLKMQVNHQARSYALQNSPRLKAEDIETILDADIRAKEAEVAASVPGFESFPELARCALLDIAFNCGVNGPTGLVHGFPKLMAAVKARDWALCSKLCHRVPPVSEGRNAFTATLFLNAWRPSQPSVPQVTT
jgi:GH24 family phage-related lysozyme (muramidase)